jgi:MerR family transcriptional regulator, heat shock protein HspR
VTALPDTTPVYSISAAAELVGLHPQTLRTYEAHGLVRPYRADNGQRRYSARDIERLRQIRDLSQREGINTAGIRRIIELQELLLRLQTALGGR